jgi:hypothetical protein
MRISRRFRIKESMNFEVLAEGFNLFNRTQVTGVNQTLYNLSGTTLSLQQRREPSARRRALTARSSASVRFSSARASSSKVLSDADLTFGRAPP